MTALIALRELSDRRFSLHPRVVLQVCSCCFNYRTVDNWSLTSHWRRCVSEGVRQRESIRQRNLAVLGGDGPNGADLDLVRDTILGQIDDVRRGRAARIGDLHCHDSIEATRNRVRDELARDESILAAVREEEERVLRRETEFETASLERSSVNGERGSDATERDFDSESSGEGGDSSAPAQERWHAPSESNGNSGETSRHENSEDNERELVNEQMREIDPEYELSSREYLSDPGFVSEWDSGVRTDSKEPEDEESGARGQRLRDNEDDLAGWATWNTRRKRNRETTSDTSLDSRLYSLCEGLDTGQTKKVAEEGWIRRRRLRRETRQRREQRANELSESEDEAHNDAKRAHRRRRKRLHRGGSPKETVSSVNNLKETT